MLKKRSFFMRTVGIIMATMMIVGLLPVNSLAESETKAEVKYVYKDNDPSTKIRTGIKAVRMDGVTYYDLYQGGKSDGPVDGNQVNFYKEVLTRNATAEEAQPFESANLLEQWAEVAEKIFEQNSTYSARIHADGDFAQNFGNRWKQAGYTDVSRALSQESASEQGEKSWDYTRISGIRYADSLKTVRQRACGEIVGMIDTYSLDNEYEDNKNTFFDHTDGDNTMKSLNDDKKQDVFYTMVTCVDAEGATYAFNYNTFVLAFYDFKLVPLAGEGLSYITNAEGYDLEEASRKGIPGVSYNSTHNDNPSVSYYENKSKTSNNVSLSLSQTHTETASNTFNSSKTFNFSETLGYTRSWKTILLGENAAISGDITNTITGSFTTGQVLSTGYSDTKSVTDTNTSNLSSSLTLPAQTAAVIETSRGKTDLDLEYKCPVAISYKVAIASMGGKVYADRWKVISFKTAGYTQKTFSTTFGCDSNKGGTTARSNLYKRAVENVNTAGFEEAYGNTYGYRNRHGGDTYRTETLDMNALLDQGTVTVPDNKVPYEVIYKEVDTNGKETGVTLDSYDGSGQYSYSTTIKATNPYEYKYIYSDDTMDNPEEYKLECTLYKKAVTNEKGEKVDNTFVNQTNNKIIDLNKQSGNKIVFYYQVDWDQVPEEHRPNNQEASEPEESEESQTPDSGSSVVDTNTFRNIIGWLGTHDPLSATGAKISYMAESSSTSVGDIIPLYSLRTIYLDNNVNIGDMVISEKSGNKYVGSYYDANSLLDLTLYPGDKFLTRNVDLIGLNVNNVSYYGFGAAYGEWKTVKKTEDGEWVVDRSSSNIASLVKDDVTKNQYVLAGEEEGTYYIQYFINEQKYKSKQDVDYVTNEMVDRPIIRINVKKAPFAGKVSLSGEYTGTVGDEAVKFDDVLDLFVTDADGKKIDKTAGWETKQKSGITVSEDGSFTFEKAGTYQVRASVENVYSEWVNIVAKDPAALTSITFETPDFTKTEVTLTEGRKSLSFDLPSYLGYYDQYGKEWNEAKPDVTFSLYDDNGANISGDQLVVTQEGSYKVYAKADGFSIRPITITVTDDRKAGEIKLSGKYEAIVGDPADNIGEFLTVTIKDPSGKEVLQDYTWDAQELNGITITQDGQIQASKAGTYHVRIKTESGQYSDWCTVTAQNPTITLDKSSLTMTNGSNASLKAAFTYSHTANKKLTWTSNNASVTVDQNGSITSNNVGSATITVTNAYGYKAQCLVKVTNPIIISNVKKSGKAVTLTWNKVAGAKGYDVYASVCKGKNNKLTLQKSVPATKLKLKLSKIDKKAINKDCYKFQVKAYKLVNNKKVYLATSLPCHIQYKKSGKYTNASKITLKNNKTISKGSTYKLQSVVTLEKGKKQINHEKPVRYISSDPGVATVDYKGNVKAVSAGSCKIYAVAINGKSAAVTITVK